MDGGVLGADGVGDILGEGGVGEFVMSGAPLMLFAVGADLDGDRKFIFAHRV